MNFLVAALSAFIFFWKLKDGFDSFLFNFDEASVVSDITL